MEEIMEKSQARALAVRVRKAGGTAEVYEEYVGRGMAPMFPGDKGRSTTGVVMDRSSAQRFGTKHARDDMGMDVIVY